MRWSWMVFLGLVLLSGCRRAKDSESGRSEGEDSDADSDSDADADADADADSDSDGDCVSGTVSDHEGIAMAYICEGTFTMGSPGEEGRGTDETQHDVTLTGGDSTTLTYDPLNPTNGPTSSIFLAGGIKAHRASNSSLVKGDVRLTAVEVQVGGGISITNADSSTHP